MSALREVWKVDRQPDGHYQVFSTKGVFVVGFETEASASSWLADFLVQRSEAADRVRLEALVQATTVGQRS